MSSSYQQKAQQQAEREAEWEQQDPRTAILTPLVKTLDKAGCERMVQVLSGQRIEGVVIVCVMKDRYANTQSMGRMGFVLFETQELMLAALEDGRISVALIDTGFGLGNKIVRARAKDVKREKVTIQDERGREMNTGAAKAQPPVGDLEFERRKYRSHGRFTRIDKRERGSQGRQQVSRVGLEAGRAMAERRWRSADGRTQMAECRWQSADEKTQMAERR